MSIKGKIALVTGASGGIGSAIAVSLAAQGAVVIGTGSNEKSISRIENLFGEAGLKGFGKAMNIQDVNSIEYTMDSIKNEFGAIDIMVNNAGITNDNLMLRMKAEEWNNVIQTNLNSIYHITKNCLRDMVKARWGRIVNITSIVGVMGNPGQANYAAAKAGMIGFSKSLAYEVASRGVTVNCVAPGFIDTPMTQKLTDEQKASIMARIPMNRLGLPQDIATSVGFLVSEEASYITGQTLHVNGGMCMI